MRELGWIEDTTIAIEYRREEVRMHLKSIFAALVIVAAPVSAQAQKKPTRADVQKVFEIISGDEVKLQAFCDIDELGDQIEEANAKKDFKKVQELALKADELGRKLSPEYGVLMNEIQNVDRDSEDGQQISSTILALEKLCARE